MKTRDFLLVLKPENFISAQHNTQEQQNKYEYISIKYIRKIMACRIGTCVLKQNTCMVGIINL